MQYSSVKLSFSEFLWKLKLVKLSNDSASEIILNVKLSEKINSNLRNETPNHQCASINNSLDDSGCYSAIDL